MTLLSESIIAQDRNRRTHHRSEYRREQPASGSNSGRRDHAEEFLPVIKRIVDCLRGNSSGHFPNGKIRAQSDHEPVRQSHRAMSDQADVPAEFFSTASNNLQTESGTDEEVDEDDPWLIPVRDGTLKTIDREKPPQLRAMTGNPRHRHVPRHLVFFTIVYEADLHLRTRMKVFEKGRMISESDRSECNIRRGQSMTCFSKAFVAASIAGSWSGRA